MKLVVKIALLLFIPAVIPTQDEETQYFLYTRSNPNSPIILNHENLHKLQDRPKTVIIIHGAIATSHDNDFPVLKDEYLKRYDCNVILLDWAKLAAEPYFDIVRKLPECSRSVAQFLCKAHEQLHISIPNVHIIGHSCGAHMGGFVGKSTVATCGQKVGRVTGLDPAGPIYSFYPKEKRLDKSDALFVDVIHTNTLGLGFLNTCGHVDFYVNCGGLQNGCGSEDSDNLEDNLFECSHLRAISYMIESVNRNNFVGQSCAECPSLMCKGDEVDPEYIAMGEDTPQNSTNKVFWLPTNASSPFGIGCTPYQ